MYSVEDFKRVTHAILSNDQLAEQVLEFHLTEGSNQFLAMGSQDRQQLVSQIYATKERLLKALAQSFYSPYLLMELIDKHTFMR